MSISIYVSFHRKFCERHDMIIVSDEIHSELILDKVVYAAHAQHNLLPVDLLTSCL